MLTHEQKAWIFIQTYKKTTALVYTIYNISLAYVYVYNIIWYHTFEIIIYNYLFIYIYTYYHIICIVVIEFYWRFIFVFCMYLYSCNTQTDFFFWILLNQTKFGLNQSEKG